MIVWTVEVLRGATAYDVQLFSAEEKAQEYAYGSEHPCIVRRREVDVIDEPEDEEE